MKNIITLKDASGTDIEFKMLDQFTHEERTYVVLMPHNESTTQVSIYEVVPTKDAVSYTHLTLPTTERV